MFVDGHLVEWCLVMFVAFGVCLKKGRVTADQTYNGTRRFLLLLPSGLRGLFIWACCFMVADTSDGLQVIFLFVCFIAHRVGMIPRIEKRQSAAYLIFGYSDKIDVEREHLLQGFVHLLPAAGFQIERSVCT